MTIVIVSELLIPIFDEAYINENDAERNKKHKDNVNDNFLDKLHR